MLLTKSNLMPYPSQGCGLEIEPASHKRTSYWFPLLLESSSMIFRFLNALVGFGLFDRGFLVVGSCVEIGIPMLILFIALSQYLKNFQIRQVPR